MFIELTFDVSVESGFYWTGEYPHELIGLIGKQKRAIYTSLTPRAGDPDILEGTWSVQVKDRTFLIYFESDQQQIDPEYDIRPLRVLRIQQT